MDKRVFGPVPSRRLGRSLGVDVVPFKTCNYDCLYCQLGPTTCKTTELGKWFPWAGFMPLLQEKIAAKPDIITIAGSGDPSLYAEIGPLIKAIKELTSIPVAVLTNGGMFWRPEVRQAMMRADVLIPSLDAGNAELFEQINRPAPSVSFEQMLDGMIAMRQAFPGDYWLEVMLLDGLNTTAKALSDLANCISKINPDKVQLNTVVRPGGDPIARPVSLSDMVDIAEILPGEVEIVGSYAERQSNAAFVVHREDVLQMLERRPCSLTDLASGLSLHRNEVLKYVAELRDSGKIGQKYYQGIDYYFVIES